MYDNKREIVFEKLAQNFKIYIDTGSLLNKAFERWFDRIKPFLKKYNNCLRLLPKVVEELNLNINNADLNIASTTSKIVKFLKNMQDENLIKFEVCDIDKARFNYFNDFFLSLKPTDKILLVTQDYDIYKSIVAQGVEIRRINKSSDTSKFRPDDISKIDPRILRLSKPAFMKTNIMISNDDRINPITKIPEENDFVYDDKGKAVKLIKRISAGGEGLIYTTDTQCVAKIYKKRNNTEHKFAKLKLMVSTSFDCEGVCYPVSLLYNSAGHSEFVGYLMPKARGVELQKSVFLKPLFEKEYASWSRKDLVQLLVTILHKIVYLHSKNLIIGDINPANILFISPMEVYFVDTDSYQIGPFPCPVGTINFTAPEIQGRHFGDFLRTMENENFAVATLCFMIMMTGKTPYSHQGGTDPAGNIIKMHFPYRFGMNVTDEVPDGLWKYMWSHLPYIVKEAFYNIFSSNGKCSKPNKRLRSSEWLEIFKNYLKMFNRGELQKQDEMSLEIWPTRAKKVDKTKFKNF
ncbi:hypothetical protein [uncultured Campylobacter sp.]|uniref:hypothetical protein n=1 Tax=uncultured Campylobacter sp. TaxID=218934 RepID=UPI002608A908|nr:hypothetical protein [uncultured Campylobacter sp.]